MTKEKPIAELKFEGGHGHRNDCYVDIYQDDVWVELFERVPADTYGDQMDGFLTRKQAEQLRDALIRAYGLPKGAQP